MAELKDYEAKYEQEQQALWDALETSLQNDDIRMFRKDFLDMHAYERANFFASQDEAMRKRIYGYLSPTEMAEILESVEIKDTLVFFTEMDPQYSGAILTELPADDAVDILNLMDKEEAITFLTIMDEKETEEVRHLLNYEEKTAGSIMTTEFIALYDTHTVEQAMQLLKEEAPDAETIYYLYVIDEAKKLVGVLSIRDLIIAKDEAKIKDIMSEKVVTVSVARDQEEVAQIFMDYDFLAAPVVDFQNHLIGIITVDDILDVMEEEAGEDYSMLAAVSDEVHHTDTAFEAAKKRLPWLIILLFLGLITANIIGRFEETLNQVAVLAIFIPLIAGMAGNSGTQSLAVSVRSLATGDYEKQGKGKWILRELGTGIITGSISGVLITVIILIWQGNLALGLLVGFSIMISLVVATLAGAIIPMLMDRINVDPAVASGPFITTLNDIISILIYFGLATSFMSYLV